MNEREKHRKEVIRRMEEEYQKKQEYARLEFEMKNDYHNQKKEIRMHANQNVMKYLDNHK